MVFGSIVSKFEVIISINYRVRAIISLLNKSIMLHFLQINLFEIGNAQTKLLDLLVNMAHAYFRQSSQVVNSENSAFR